MDLPWFDEQSDTILLDDYVVTRESYRRITADREITEAEVSEQVQKVTGLFKHLECLLSPEAKQVATAALCELAVLHVLRATAKPPVGEDKGEPRLHYTIAEHLLRFAEEPV